MEEHNQEEVARVLQEAATEDNQGDLNRPEILQHHLPRLFGKQEPAGDWQHVPIPAWVENILGEVFAEQVLEAGQEAFQTASEEEEAEVAKRPAGRKTWPKEKCPGRSPQEPCAFSQKRRTLGEPAMLDHGQVVCRFCNDAALAEAVAEPQKRKFITRACRVWEEAGRKDLSQKVLQRLPQQDQEAIQTALQRPSRAAAAVQARAAAHAEEVKQVEDPFGKPKKFHRHRHRGRSCPVPQEKGRRCAKAAQQVWPLVGSTRGGRRVLEISLSRSL